MFVILGMRRFLFYPVVSGAAAGQQDGLAPWIFRPSRRSRRIYVEEPRLFVMLKRMLKRSSTFSFLRCPAPMLMTLFVGQYEPTQRIFRTADVSYSGCFVRVRNIRVLRGVAPMHIASVPLILNLMVFRIRVIGLGS